MIYVGNKSGKAREIKSIKTGVNGVAKNVVNGWIGENGVAKRIYSQNRSAFAVTATGYMKVQITGVGVALNWGDGSEVERPVDLVTTTLEHTYSDSGQYHLTISGRIRALKFRDSTGLLAVETPLPTLTTYREMFYGCTSLTTAPALPATTLTDYCYYNMFRGCTSLTTAPELPATTLAINCYSSMFDDCTSLTTAPALPATTLTIGCYSSMFSGCTSLTTAPALPATTLTDSCYTQMFDGCTSLTTAPALPATTLTDWCYYRMFHGCTSLTTAPELPATTLAERCCESMFTNCTSLTTAPALPATTLTDNCYFSMFRGCTKIKLSTTQTGDYQTPYRIPSSGTGTAGTNSLKDMFSNTGGTFTGTPAINTTYYTSNTVIPAT